MSLMPQFPIWKAADPSGPTTLYWLSTATSVLFFFPLELLQDKEKGREVEEGLSVWERDVVYFPLHMPLKTSY